MIRQIHGLKQRLEPAEMAKVEIKGKPIKLLGLHFGDECVESLDVRRLCVDGENLIAGDPVPAAIFVVTTQRELKERGEKAREFPVSRTAGVFTCPFCKEESEGEYEIEHSMDCPHRLPELYMPLETISGRVIEIELTNNGRQAVEANALIFVLVGDE